jgi:O-acetyl-ADP-ribose deacetylase (regulator of RNase III)
VHVVNDKTPNWGGGGFASAVRSAWPGVQEDFRDWAEHHRASYRLGSVRVSRVDERLSVASIIAQHGYGPSAKPRLRYSALRAGLTTVARLARESGASVHMPRIGTGQSGGSWPVIRDLIGETLGEAAVPVTVYDLPGSRARVAEQATLGFGRSSA